MRTKINLLLIFTLSPLFLMWSCQPYSSQADLKKVDSLQKKVDKVEGGLDVDIQTFKDRHDTIKKIQGYLEEELKKEQKEEFGTALVRFEGIGNNYSNFIENYELLKYENEKHAKRLKDLKKDLVEGNIEAQQFDSIYKREQKIINQHFQTAQQLFESVTKVENIYWRNHNELKSVYQRLKKKRAKRGN